MRVICVVALIGGSLVGSACTDGGSVAAVEDPRARLETLAAMWGSDPTTITYRTTERDPGEATSPHQCLRQLVGEAEVDVQTGLRTCSGVGEVRLAWDPPERWRMDEVSPRSLTWLSTGDGEVRCRGDAPGLRCAAAEGNGPFGSLVDTPAAILDQIGAPVTAEADRTIAGIRSECFLVEGDRGGTIHRVEWCYSRDGLLLFLLDEIEGGRMATAEATQLASGVTAGDFVVR